MNPETAYMIMGGFIIIQNLLLLSSILNVYRALKIAVDLWRQMSIALCDVEGLIHKLKLTDVADTRSGGNEIKGVVADDNKTGVA